MNSFEFFNVPRIVFGRGQFARIADLARPLGVRALIIHNGPQDIPDKLRGLLTAEGLTASFFRQRGEPKVADIDAALLVARESCCDMVMGLGGGSAIDSAKAVAGLLTNRGAALDYMEVVGKGQKITKAAAPWIAIPTTSGTGAEVTRNAVIGSPEHHFKASIRGEQLLARVALVDPELGISTPADVTASSGMDALCQCIESYTSTGAHPLSDALAMQGIVLAARSLKIAYEDGTNLNAREEMALSALLSGITLTNAGLGAVHGFAAPLGANFPVPHGTVCAALLPHVIHANVVAMQTESPRHPSLRRYAEVGKAMANDPTLPEEMALSFAQEFCAQLSQHLRIPSLSQFGISLADVPAMVALAKKASSMKFNPVILSDESLTEILTKAI